MSVSLYCSASNLRVLVGSVNARQARIDAAADLALPENAMLNGIITGQDAMRRFLTEVNETHGPFRQEAVLCVESSLVRTRVITIPKVPEQQMLRFVTEELNSALDTEADDVFDFAVLGPNRSKGGIDVLGIAVGRALLATYISVFEEAGFKLRHIDVGANALIKVATFSPHLLDGNDLLALIDDATLFLVLFDHGRFVLVKKYRLMAAPNTDERRREVGEHLSTFVQFQKTQNSEGDVHAVHVAGISAERIAQLAELVSYLQMPIIPLDIDEHLKFSDKMAFGSGDFESYKYLFNIGALMGR
ncbi:MAG: pilus assembly protein PilM [Coriobacteriales bacterium]|nr:pilus assembly protein PilM [Coriobacteriales bacterium]